MEGVKETLAGRVAIMNLFGLSDEEKRFCDYSPAAHFQGIMETTFPKLSGVRGSDVRQLYLSSYVQTYIERDVRELLRIEKRREFEIFLKMCALRSAQVVNYDDLARDAGISAVTAKNWLSLLEDSFLIKLVPPYHTNRTKRLIKSPKLYFLDMGLCAYLAGWHDPEALRLGPLGGAAFETHVFGEILRCLRHRLQDAEVNFWRTRDGQEIDFIVEVAGRCYPIEVKMGRPKSSDLVSLAPIADPNWEQGQVVSLSAKKVPELLSDEWRIVSPAGLRLHR
jgi:predicted AAA+ superfamily ATPase